MKTTIHPELIYDILARYGFPALRIDHFDRGDYAEIRAELGYSENLRPLELQDIALKLNLIEKNEGIRIHIVNIDMIHKTMRVNIVIDEPDEGSP